MAANLPNPGAYMQQIGIHLTALRDAFNDLLKDNDYLTQMGGATFLQNSMGLSPTDAAALVAALGNHANLNTHYNGGAQAPALNYRLNGSPFWGGNLCGNEYGIGSVAEGRFFCSCQFWTSATGSALSALMLLSGVWLACGCHTDCGDPYGSQSELSACLGCSQQRTRFSSLSQPQ